jgi:hypothetical protein
MMIVNHRDWAANNRAQSRSRALIDYDDILVDEVDTRLSAREGSIGRSLNMMRPNELRNNGQPNLRPRI